MRARGWYTRMIWAGSLATILAGCKSFFAPRGIPNDPLLVGRQPIESKGQVMPAPVLARHEPEPPGEDRLAVAQKSPRPLPVLPASRPLRGND